MWWLKFIIQKYMYILFHFKESKFSVDLPHLHCDCSSWPCTFKWSWQKFKRYWHVFCHSYIPFSFLTFNLIYHITGVHFLDVNTSFFSPVAELGLKPEENDKLGSIESLIFFPQILSSLGYQFIILTKK